MNHTKNQQILSGFLKAILLAPKEIKYNSQYMDHRARVERGEINFMNIITHPTIRITLKADEFAVTRAVHPNPRYAKFSNVILMRGTQYGLIAMFGVEADYHVNQKNNVVYGPDPKLHTTRAFLMAADRFFKRRGITFNVMHGSEQQLLEWIFSPSFAADLAEQAQIDKAAGIALGDGLPPKPAHKRPANRADSKPSNDPKLERRDQKKPFVGKSRRNDEVGKTPVPDERLLERPAA